MKIFIFTAILNLSFIFLLAQGHIGHIKDQGYLKYKDCIDCDNQPGDNLSERICANLTFQKTDSLLVVIYDSLLLKAKKHYIDSLENKIIKMQDTWRAFRDQHCAIIYDSYDGCGGCHQRAIDYLNCLTALTKTRIEELEKLRNEISGL